ncbi:uncharacterized protein LOC135343148 [Halichondria panicea]|uniref:uncharacterized protein LOC135343148 n=1 Tax=Halichondria panicea TaxID=6063 RepID=UPI00312B7043
MATCCDNVDASVILDTLIERTGITEDQLDGTVEEGHLLKLAGLFGGWEKYVGVPGLGLNEAQKADVRDAVFLGGLIKALTFWLKRNPYYNYRSLIEILLELKERLLAVNVCNTVTTLTFGSKESRPVSGDLPTLEPFEPTDKSAADTTTSVLVTAMPSNDAALSDKVKWFEAQFYSLQESAQAELTREGVTVENFRQSLARLSSSIKAEHEKFVKKKYDTFQKAKSIEEIFVHLNSSTLASLTLVFSSTLSTTLAVLTSRKR